MRNFMQWSWAKLAMALALTSTVMLPAMAIAQVVTTRLVVPGGTATTTSIVPGGSATFEVRIDAPTVQTVGTAYRLSQTLPVAPNALFSVTARSITGSPYNDPSSGAT